MLSLRNILIGIFLTLSVAFGSLLAAHVSGTYGAWSAAQRASRYVALNKHLFSTLVAY